jgi:hypothetical protein
VIPFSPQYFKMVQSDIIVSSKKDLFRHACQENGSCGSKKKPSAKQKATRFVWLVRYSILLVSVTRQKRRLKNRNGLGNASRSAK